MKKLITNVLAALLSSLFLKVAFAHDPALHMKNAEKPKCEAMKEMDHSKMDANDPVMMALMKKCEKAMLEGNHHPEQNTLKSKQGENHNEK